MKRGYVYRAAIWIFLILALALSLYFDREISKSFYEIRNYILNNLILSVVFLSSEIFVFLFLTILFFWNKGKRRFVLPVWITLILTSIVGFILKEIFQRVRPFQEGIISLLPGIDPISGFSFPSGHALIVFCAFPWISKEFPKIKWFWAIFAGLVALSRVYIGAHYLSDVISGGVIGYLIGISIIRINENLIERNK